MDTKHSGPQVAVLGGSGFVGAPVCTALDEAGCVVVSVARRPNPMVPSIAADLLTLSPAELTGLLHAALPDPVRPRAVVNVAGAVWGVTEAQMVRTNAVLVETLCAAMAGLPGGGRLIQLGTVYEYGVVPDGSSVSEDAPTRPVSPYGVSKLRATRSVLAAADSGVTEALVLRVSNVIGRAAPPGSLLGKVASELERARGQGTSAVLNVAPRGACRDFIDSRDVADAVVRAVTAPARLVNRTVINVGTGAATPVWALVRALAEVAGVPALITESEVREHIRGAGVRWQQVDIGLAARLLGWAPRRSLDDSLATLWTAIR
jgi:dTDP-6-deoxy-L-talose 4-dehydrogenase [NAD(P)+]